MNVSRNFRKDRVNKNPPGRNVKIRKSRSTQNPDILEHSFENSIKIENSISAGAGYGQRTGTDMCPVLILQRNACVSIPHSKLRVLPKICMH